MIVVSIPQPCHEKWDAMIPENDGRFCGSCQKVVVDFSAMSDDEVRNYLLRNAHQKTCGRFLASQINRPLENKPIEINPHWYGQLPYARQVFYAVAIFFVLGVSSCTWGVVDTKLPEKLADTVFEATVGIISPPMLEDTLTPIPVKPTIIFVPPKIIKGEPEIENRIAGGISIYEPEPIVDTPVIVEPMIQGDMEMGEPAILDTAKQ